MLLFLGLSFVSTNTLHAQLTSCPDWSICVEVDPDNCNELRVTLNGLANLPILTTYFYIYLNDPALTINGLATTSSFQGTTFGMHPYWGSSPLQVNSNQIRLTYAAPFDPFTSSEDCIHLGNIVLIPPEDDCHDFDLDNITLGQVGTGTGTNTPLVIGDNYLSNPPPLFCNVLTLDCPCSESVCPDDWGVCFLETGECDRVRVLITGLGGEDLAGMVMNINLDPNIPAIVEQATQTSYQNSWFASQPWGINQINFNGNQISISNIDLSGSFTVPSNAEFLMDIYFEAEPGECYSFSEPTLDFGLSGVRIGENFAESERCDLSGLTCQGFETCCESVTLSGNVLRSPDGPACDEGINYGFPGGTVEVSSNTSYFNTTLITDPDGSYTVEVFPNQTYTVRPDYTSDFLDLCGVNSADIDEIRDVILAVIPCFPNLDVANAAADMSDDNSITTFDILLVQQWILGFPSSSNNDVWRFMKNDDYLIDFAGSPACPGLSVPTYDREDIVPVVTSPVTSDFRAVKMGDVDGTCTECIDPNALMGGRDIDLIAKWNKDRNAFEFSLDDPLLNGITVLALVVNGNGLKDKVSKTFSPDDELLVAGRGSNGVGMVWSSTTSDGVSLDQNQVIMEIPIDASVQRLSDLNLELNVGEMMMNGQRYLFNLIVEEKESKEGEVNWSVYPNPASDFIFLHSPNGLLMNEYMDMDIINVNGQIVERREGMRIHNDGNRISIRELNSGMYILRLRNTDEEVQIPFVKMRP